MAARYCPIRIPPRRAKGMSDAMFAGLLAVWRRTRYRLANGLRVEVDPQFVPK